MEDYKEKPSKNNMKTMSEIKNCAEAKELVEIEVTKLKDESKLDQVKYTENADNINDEMIKVESTLSEEENVETNRIACDSEDNSINQSQCTDLNEENATKTRKRKETRQLLCHVCHKTFVRTNDLKRHTSLVHATGHYTCEQCGKHFKCVEYLFKHTRCVHSSLPNIVFECHSCNKVFKKKYLLNNHKWSAHSNPRFRCVHCDKMFRDNRALDVHISLVHEDTYKYKCNVCERIFKTKASLNRHRKDMHSAHKCSKCTAGFNTKSNLDKHVRSIHPSTFDCKICFKKFNAETFLKHHSRAVHSTEGDHKCLICNTTYKNRNYLQMHLRDVHSNRLWACSTCHRTLKTKSVGIKHVVGCHCLVLENDITVLKCNRCFEIFEDAVLLRRHIRIGKCMHLVCIPHKESAIYASLRKIKKKATEKKKYKCNNCLKTYKYRRSLCAHIRDNESCSAKSHGNSDLNFLEDSVIVKKEPGIEDLDIGPVVLQHVDVNFRPFEEKFEKP